MTGFPKCINELEPGNIPIAMARSNPKGYNLDYLLQRVREDISQRIGDANWAGGKSLVVDCTDCEWTVPGVTVRDFLSVSTCLENSKEVFLNLPLNHYDGIILNFLPSWLDFEGLLGSIYGSLRPGGLFAFSTFGPDTLGEVAMAWQEVDNLPHVHSFTDMHHLGDSMLSSGMARPIVDAEWITINYPDFETLTRDLRYSGFGNVHVSRRKSLTGKQRYRVFIQTLQELSPSSDEIPVTYEIVYGLGLKIAKTKVLVAAPDR